MTEINEILLSRKANLVNNVANLSKSKFFAIRALDYCIGFVTASALNSDKYEVNENITPNPDSNLPAEWIVQQGNNLISPNFDNYDTDGSHPRTIRVVNYVRSQLFIALMSELEDYLSQLVEMILLAYPENLQSEHFDVQQALQNVDAEEQIAEKAQQKIKKKKYGKLKQFFNFVKHTLGTSTNGNQPEQLDELFPKYVEMKLRRDAGVHSGWLKSSFYRQGLDDYDIPDCQGDFLGVDEAYFRQAMEVAIDLVATCNAFCQLNFSNVD